MPSAASLVSAEKTTDLPLNLGTLRVTYNPQLIVALQESDQPEPEDEDEARNQQAEQLCMVVKAWDLTGPVPTTDLPGIPRGAKFGSDTEPIPFDPQIVRYLPFSLLSELITAISLDAAPDPTRMLKRLRRRGSTPTSTPSNGRQDDWNRSPSGSTIS